MIRVATKTSDRTIGKVIDVGRVVYSPVVNLAISATSGRQRAVLFHEACCLVSALFLVVVSGIPEDVP